MTLKLGQVIERIGPAEFAGVDQAHEHIPDVGAMASLVEQRILAMENRLLDRIVIIPSLLQRFFTTYRQVGQAFC